VDCQKAPPHLCRPLVPNTFFDGSIQPDCPTTSRPESIKEDDWISVSISKGEIGVVKVPADPNIGVSYPMPLYNPYLCPPPFALAPRARVLKFTRLDCEDFAKKTDGSMRLSPNSALYENSRNVKGSNESYYSSNERNYESSAASPNKAASVLDILTPTKVEQVRAIVSVTYFIFTISSLILLALHFHHSAMYHCVIWNS
jgi:hypothetical protein